MYIFNKIDISFNLIFSILIINFLPSFFFVAFNTSSLALGLVIASVLVLLINLNYIKKLKVSLLSFNFFMLLSILLFISVSYFYVVESFSKPFYSMMILLIFFSSLALALKISTLSYIQLSNSILILILILLIIGFIKLAYVPNFLNYSHHLKSVFPFSEESHYALSLGILAVAYALVGNLYTALSIGLAMLSLALFFPSMTLLVYVFLVFFACLFRLKPIYYKLLLITTPILIIAFLVFIISDLEYFSSRLNFQDTTNLTTLVYLQGWDLAYLNLIKTDGIGLGFQMLGSPITQLSSYTDIIQSLYNKTNNISDGGFLAAKLIAEFGVLGVLAISFYFYFIIKFIFRGNTLWNKIHLLHDNEYINNIKKELLLLGILFGFLVEVFLRGYGYFSPGLYLFVSILLVLNLSKNNLEKVY